MLNYRQPCPWHSLPMCLLQTPLQLQIHGAAAAKWRFACDMHVLCVLQVAESLVQQQAGNIAGDKDHTDEEEAAAAVKLQAAYRGHYVRQHLLA
jgi:hypothetical protein